MPIEYKNEFISLYEKKKSENYQFFKIITEEISYRNFTYLECNIDEEILKCALKLAEEKSKFTMDQNQAAIRRDKYTKIKKCAQGVLAEMFLHILLMERYGFEVKRYDLERETFQYKTEEYDLKIIFKGKEYEVESRSSNLKHFSVRRFVKQDCLIGPYVNAIKESEEYADFHFRPVYLPEFVPYAYENGNWVLNKRMLNGSFRLIITSLATKDDFLKNSRTCSLGQKGTTYHVVDISKAGDVNDMDKKISDFKNRI